MAETNSQRSLSRRREKKGTIMHFVLLTGIAIGSLMLVVFAVGAMLPAAWTVSRSITIAAPATAVYPLIASFKAGWTHWNPWIEPGMVVTYSGPDAGIGATQNWTGGDTNGGMIKITKADPMHGINFALTFGPFPIDGQIHLAENNRQTLVTWTDQGIIAGQPVYRFMRFGLNRFVGTPMERGLTSLKRAAEGAQSTRVSGDSSATAGVR